MKKETVKGFADFSGEEAKRRENIRKLFVETFERYGFEAAETPIIEYEDFVKGENANDEAVSDIFRLTDKGGRKLALRYEFTFQLKRIMENKKLPYKRYQIGPVFRDEPVSAKRLRQFTQCDVDTIGSSIKEESELLALTSELFSRLGITPIILVNNRKLLNEILDDNDIKGKNREQTLREIDKIDKLTEKEVRANLRKLGAENVLDSLKKGEKYFAQFASYKEIISLMEYCKVYKVNAQFSPSIVRGLSYYNGTVFEIKVKGVKETLAAGGSYEVNGIAATGISFGLERLSILAQSIDKRERVILVSLDEDRATIALAQKLRGKGELVGIYYGKPSKALEFANAYGYTRAVFVGAREVKAKKFKIKNLKSGKESTLKI